MSLVRQPVNHVKSAIHGKDRISYSQFLERLRATAAGFQSQAIGKGDRVLVHVNNGIDGFVAACSIPLTGATLVTSDVTFSEEELLDHAAKTDATHVLTDEGYFDLFKRIAPRLKFKKIFSLTDLPGCISIAKFSSIEATEYKEVLGCDDRVVFVAHSTGTTGVSKIIEITQRNFLSQICCRETFKLATSEDICLGGGNISFYVCYTYSFFIVSIGATLVLLDKYSPIPDVFAAFRDHKANVVHATPMKILQIVFDVKNSGQSFPHVKKFTTLGTPMSEKIKSEILSAFSPSEVRSCYGMTEVSGYLSAPPSGEFSAGDVGFPVSSARLKIVDAATGTLLGPNQTGEVLFHTPHFMVGYYKDPAETASFTNNEGWVRTGDLGYYNEDGRLFITGRVKAATLPAALRSGLSTVEECLHFHPSVAEAAVVPIVASQGEGHLAAVVVTRPEHKPSRELAQRIKSFVRENLPTAPLIEAGIFFTDSIPRSGFGKIKRRLLREQMAELERMD
ncbi:luciferin 4-monooxygenase-like isoform X2 [Amblyomma americanum]